MLKGTEEGANMWQAIYERVTNGRNQPSSFNVQELCCELNRTNSQMFYKCLKPNEIFLFKKIYRKLFNFK